MGFFSRTFDSDMLYGDSISPTRDDGQNSESRPDTTAILAEIDIDTAIAAHENWKLRLQNYLNGKSTEDLRPELVCLDDRCDLGKWLHGTGKMRLGSYPAFSVLVARHKYFHVQASSVVALAQAGERDKADLALATSYRHASNQVVLLLKELKLGLAPR